MLLARALMIGLALAAGARLSAPPDEPSTSTPADPVVRAGYPFMLAEFHALNSARGQDPAPAHAPNAVAVEGEYLRLAGARPTHGLDLLWAYSGTEDGAMGLTLSALDPALRSQLKIPADRGLLVSSVAAGGPAEQVGFKPSDIILTLGDGPILEAEDLSKQLKNLGEAVGEIHVLRHGKPEALKVRAVTRVAMAPAAPEKPQYYLGVQTTPPDSQLRAHVKIPDGQGLVISEVVADSPAEKAKVQVGDIALKLDDTPLTDTETLVAQIQATQGNASKLTLIRGGEEQTIVVTPAVRPRAEATTAARWLGGRDNPEAITYGYTLNNPHWRAVTTPRAVAVQGRALPYINYSTAPPQWLFYHGTDANAQEQGQTAPAADLNQRLSALKTQVDSLQRSIEDLHKAIEDSKK